MCMSGGGSSAASQTQQETPQQVSLPPAQQQLAASGSTPTAAADPSRPKAGQRRARENAKYADKTNPNTRRGDAGGITM